MTFIDPQSEYQYGSMKRKANLAYGQGIAQNDFNLGNQAANYGTKRTELVRQFGEMRNKAPYAYNRRGLMRSGVYQGGLQQMQQQHLRGLQEMDTANAQQVGQLQLSRQGLELERGGGLGEAEDYRNATMQQMALKRYLDMLAQAGVQ